MVEVRKATHDDVPWLLEQITAFEAFAAYKKPLITGNSAAPAVLAGLIDRHVVLIAHEDDIRHGFIAGFQGSHPLNRTLRVLSEIFWWIAEEHRGHGRAALVLLNEFERMGRETADWVIFTLEHHSPVRDAHITGRGFRLVERAFLLEV